MHKLRQRGVGPSMRRAHLDCWRVSAFSRAGPVWVAARSTSIRTVLALLGLAFCSISALADDKPTLKLTTPTTTVRLFGAHCLWNCWFSSLFAPAIARENVAALPVINASTDKVTLRATFVPTNGLAMGQESTYLALVGPQREQMVGAKDAQAVELAGGATAQLKLALVSSDLPSGLYTGQIELRAEPAAGNANPVTEIIPIELRIRASALWAVLTVLFGIVLGRLAQLVYDPKVMQRVQLLDWLNELEDRIAQAPQSAQAALTAKLNSLRTRLFSRGIEPASLQAEFQALEAEINNAITATGAPVAMTQFQAQAQARSAQSKPAAAVNSALRILAGVTPLPLSSVYDWLLPVFTLLTLIVLTVVFVLQQYGGTGTAETFGSGGLADYAALFLAGVASEAITGGLRAIKLH